MAGNRVLVVDDELSIRSFIKVNLEARGYQVLTAANGHEAIDAVQKGKPDLVILDIVMPGMNGFEACRIIRISSQVPIIMLSAREGENDMENCAAYGANDYLTKPFILRELLNKIQLICDGKNSS
jgi:DNA-binding response OmpR family regulator